MSPESSKRFTERDLQEIDYMFNAGYLRIFFSEFNRSEYLGCTVLGDFCDTCYFKDNCPAGGYGDPKGIITELQETHPERFL